MKILKDILYKVAIEAVKGSTDVAINAIDIVTSKSKILPIVCALLFWHLLFGNKTVQ